jgi:iron(III) transport system ATP-binding protein
VRRSRDSLVGMVNSGHLAPVKVVVSGVGKTFDGPVVLTDVDLSVEPGEIVALLGPSGCGKTTLLRSIAGLESVDSGEIIVGDRLVSSMDVSIAPEKRRVGMVFQDWALFPHMSVAKNVGYGLDRNERAEGRIEEALAMVGLEGLSARDPSTLSGGQQQRVALARALAPRPSVLLLDEPFSNLDTTLRVQVRLEVRRILLKLGITTIFVTHDQEEAFVLGDRVAVMNDGQIVQIDSPAELYARPASAWVADFVGDANLYPADVQNGLAVTMVGKIPLAEGAPEGPIQVLVRPEQLELVAGDDGVVDLVEFYGHDAMYEVVLDDGQMMRVRTTSRPDFSRGDRVCVRYTGPPAVAYAAD